MKRIKAINMKINLTNYIYMCVHTHTHTYTLVGFPDGTRDKEPACQCERHERCRFDPWVGEIPWKKEMATHSRILADRIPWTEKPGGLQSIGFAKNRTCLKRLSTADS